MAVGERYTPSSGLRTTIPHTTKRRKTMNLDKLSEKLHLTFAIGQRIRVKIMGLHHSRATGEITKVKWDGLVSTVTVTFNEIDIKRGK